MLLVFTPAVVLAADPVPIIEISPGSGQGFSGAGQSFGSQEAQLMVMLQQLQDEVRNLRGQVELQQYELERMQKDQRDRYKDLDRRISLLITSSAVAPVTPSVDPGAALSPDVPLAPELSAPPVPVNSGSLAPSGLSGDDQAYQSAFALVRERKFDEAAGAFEAFVLDYPSSTRVANAHYWLGEIYLAQQKLELSQGAFARVVEGFPASQKMPDALYKLGVLNYQRGNSAESARYFERVMREFPQSSAARLAQSFKR